MNELGRTTYECGSNKKFDGAGHKCYEIKGNLNYLDKLNEKRKQKIWENYTIL